MKSYNDRAKQIIEKICNRCTDKNEKYCLTCPVKGCAEREIVNAFEELTADLLKEPTAGGAK